MVDLLLACDSTVHCLGIEAYFGGIVTGVAVELAHAAERAQRDRFFALDAVARAR